MGPKGRRWVMRKGATGRFAGPRTLRGRQGLPPLGQIRHQPALEYTGPRPGLIRSLSS